MKLHIIEVAKNYQSDICKHFVKNFTCIISFNCQSNPMVQGTPSHLPKEDAEIQIGPGISQCQTQKNQNSRFAYCTSGDLTIICSCVS